MPFAYSPEYRAMVLEQVRAGRTLPSRNQTTFGGGPFRNASCRKSESFDTMTNPWSAAYSQISTAVAVSRPTPVTWSLPANSTAS